MEQLTLEALPREPGGTGRLRRSGFVPAVVYGRGREPRSIQVAERELMAVLDRAGRHHIVQVGGEPTLVQDIQRASTTGRVLHVDFHAVSMQETVHAEVPLVVRGEEKVHKAKGAIVQHQLTSLRVACRPSDLPDFLPVEVGHLNPGDSLSVADLVLPAGVETLHDGEEVVLSILAPRVEAAEAEAGAAEPHDAAE